MLDRNRIAETLKSAREQRGLSVEQAAAAAGIPTQYLRLLEGEADVKVGVSDELYLIPFFRKYARFVGIDAEQMLPEFLGMVEQMPGEGSPPIRLTYRPRYASLWRPLAVLVTIGIAATLLLRQSRERPTFEEPAPAPVASVETAAAMPAVEVMPVPAVAATAIGVATMVPQVAAPAASVATVLPTTLSSSPAHTPSPIGTPIVVGSGSHALTIVAKEEAWMALGLDDQPSKQYMLRAGETRTWNADRFSLTVGNAGGVTLSLDGRELSSIGKPGRVVRNLRLPPEPSPAAAPTTSP
jgi:transcriptional regulator with XRE-family HTH domain